MSNKKQPARKGARATTQKSIPYIAGYANGMIQSEPGLFCKTYAFPDVSFKTLSDEEQQAFYSRFQTFLNSSDDDERVTFNLINTAADAADLMSLVRYDETGDGLDEYRRELNGMLKGKLQNSKAQIRTKRFVTYAFECDKVAEAAKRFDDIDVRVESAFRAFVKQEPHAMSIGEKVALLGEIYGTASTCPFIIKDDKGNPSIDFRALSGSGETVRDILAPTYMKFGQTHFQIGEEYGQALFLNGIANQLPIDFIADVMSVNARMCVSLDITALNQDEAAKLIHNKAVLINNEIAARQKQAFNAGYMVETAGSSLDEEKDQILELQQDISARDQRMFFFQMNVTHFAPDMETLKRNRKLLETAAKKSVCGFGNYIMLQERGFNSTLPLGVNHTLNASRRLLPTASVAAFMPFTEASTLDEGGYYYGINTINKSLVVLDRMKGQNYNGLIFGASGSGKSFASKQEMINTILKTNAEIFIIDPDGEYGKLVRELGGEEIKVIPGGRARINPMDINFDTTYDTDMSPVAMKSDFLIGLCESFLGGGIRAMQCDPIARSVIDTSVSRIYSAYKAHVDEVARETGRQPFYNREEMPTLHDLMQELLARNVPQAQELVLVMEPYVTGNFNIFADRTNVDITNRVTSFNIRDIGDNLKEIGLKVCLNFVWNRMIENRARGKWTWIYIDEFHVLLSSPSTSAFVKNIWLRARKYWGCPTGITQNVEALLLSSDARAIINNTDFAIMLNQAPLDIADLRDLMKLSENEIQFISSVEAGRGIIKRGAHHIPFTNEFPTNTKLYRLMSTKAGEIL